MRRSNATVVVTIVVSVGVALLAPQAGAVPLTVTTDHPAIAGVPFSLQADGTAAGTAPADPNADTDPAIGVALMPTGAVCAASYAETVGDLFSDSASWKRGDPASEPFHRAWPIVLNKPGAYRACGYFGLEGVGTIGMDASATTFATGAVPITVARPTVTSTVAFDGTPSAGARIRLLGDLSSNAPETVTFHLNTSDTACASTAANNETNSKLALGIDEFVYGGPERVAREIVLPSSPGSYSLCTYAWRASDPGDPDLVQTGPALTITQAPPPSTAPGGATATGDLSGSPDIDAPSLTPPPRTSSTITNAVLPAARCTLSRSTVIRGLSVWVRCQGAKGPIRVTLTRPKGVRRTLQLPLNRGGSARLRTGKFTAGTWELRVVANRRTSLLEPLAVLPSKRPRS